MQALADAHKALYGEQRIGHPDAMKLRNRPLIDKWTFSTNGVSIQGRYGIPCVGFGPGAESQAQCAKRDHVEAGPRHMRGRLRARPFHVQR